MTSRVPVCRFSRDFHTTTAEMAMISATANQVPDEPAGVRRGGQPAEVAGEPPAETRPHREMHHQCGEIDGRKTRPRYPHHAACCEPGTAAQREDARRNQPQQSNRRVPKAIRHEPKPPFDSRKSAQARAKPPARQIHSLIGCEMADHDGAENSRGGARRSCTSRQDAHGDHEQFFRDPVAHDPDHGRHDERKQQRVRFQPGDEIGEVPQHEIEYSGTERSEFGIRNFGIRNFRPSSLANVNILRVQGGWG